MEAHPWLTTLAELVAQVRSERGDQAAECVEQFAADAGLSAQEPLEPETIRSLLEPCGVPSERYR